MKTQSSEVERNIEQFLRNIERRARYDMKRVAYIRATLDSVQRSARVVKMALESVVLPRTAPPKLGDISR